MCEPSHEGQIPSCLRGGYTLIRNLKYKFAIEYIEQLVLTRVHMKRWARHIWNSEMEKRELLHCVCTSCLHQ